MKKEYFRTARLGTRVFKKEIEVDKYINTQGYLEILTKKEPKKKGTIIYKYKTHFMVEFDNKSVEIFDFYGEDSSNNGQVLFYDLEYLERRTSWFKRLINWKGKT